MKITSIVFSVFLLFDFLVCTKVMANHQAKVPPLLNKNDLQLVGEAQFTVLFWDIYKSRLYSQSGRFDGLNTSIIFENTYQRDISKQQLIEKTIVQWQKLKILEKDYSRFISELSFLWPNITSGDRLALQVDKQSSHFYFNDKYIGSIVDQQFAEIFLAIWLSPNTTQPAFRKKLIGDAS
jgi:hypothetical protein